MLPKNCLRKTFIFSFNQSDLEMRKAQAIYHEDNVSSFVVCNGMS